MDWQVHLPLLLLLFPLLGAFGAPLLALFGRIARRLWLLSFSFLTLVLAALLWCRVASSGTAIYVVGGAAWDQVLVHGLPFPSRIVLVVDAFAALVLLLLALAFFLALLFSIGGEPSPGGRGTAEVLPLLALSASLGIVVTGDLFNFALFSGLLCLALVLLVAHGEGDRSLRTAFEGLALSAMILSLALAGLALLYGRYNTLSIAALARSLQFGLVEKTALVLLVVALLRRCGAVPLGDDLVRSSSLASPATAALVVGASHVGLYGLMRLLFSLYGTALGGEILGGALLLSGAASLLWGTFFCLRADDLDSLATSVILAQLGYVLLGLGVALFRIGDVRAMAEYGLMALRGALTQGAVSLLASLLLLFSLGSLRDQAGTSDLALLRGRGTRGQTALFFFFAAWTLAGLPPFVGYVSKFLLHQSLFAFQPLLGALSIGSSLALAIGLIRAFHGAFLGPVTEERPPLPFSTSLAMGALFLLLLFLSVLPSWSLGRWIDPATAALLNQGGYIEAVLGGL